MAKKGTVLIVGASRGLGLALAEEYCGRDWAVIATVRRSSPRLDLLKQRFPGSLQIEECDTTDLGSIQRLRETLADRVLNVLFVNAGIARANELNALQVSDDDYWAMMQTNALAPMRVVELFHDLVAECGAIAIMSSEIGSITNSTGFWELYSSSKAALNMLMKSFAARHSDDPRALLLVAPGWVRTEMGTEDAILSVEESIPMVVDMVSRNAGKPGLRFLDRHGNPLPW